MSNITFSGLGSGIDWQELIDEMMRLERRPVAQLKAQATTLETRSSSWGILRGYIQQLESAARSLAGGDAFSRHNVAVRGLPTGKTAPLSATATGGAMPGSFQVTVHQLATAEKLGGRIEATRTEALGLEGEFLINGRRVEVEASDSLEEVAARINATNTGSKSSGVGATILKIDDDAYRLVLTSERTGEAGVELVDGANGVLRGLGILGEDTALKYGAAGGTVRGDSFSSATDPVAELLGFNFPPPAGNLRVGPPGYAFAVMIELDLETDSLEDIAAKINSASTQIGGDIGAEVVTEGEGEGAVSHLVITGAEELEDDGGVLEALGILTRSRGHQIVEGADAQVVIDGEMITRSENTISDVVSGLTFNLTAADPDLTVDAVVTGNNAPAAEQINALVRSYNDIVDFIEKQSGGSGTAIGRDVVVRGLRAQLRDAIQAQLPDDGEGGLRRLGEIGIEIDRNGRFTVDSNRLNDALASDPEGVERLFGLRESTGEGEGRGIAVALQEITKSLLGREGGSINSITERIGEQIGGVNRRIEQMEARLERKHEQLIRQYAALEQLLSQSQSQMNWLVTQIGALNSLNIGQR